MASTLLLGAPDRKIKENESTTWEANKVGGLPDWLKGDLRGSLPCQLCGRDLLLVTQIYCPLTASPYHRCLHVFVCLSKACSEQSQGWRVVRTQLLQKSLPQLHASFATDTWNSAQDDWGEGQDDWNEGQDDWGEDSDEEEGEHGTSSTALSTSDDPGVQKLAQMTVQDSNWQAEEAADLQRDVQSEAAISGPEQGDDGAASESADTMDGEKLEGVEGETITVDEESVQRMLGLLAKSDEAGAKGNESVQDSELAPSVVFPAYYLEVFAESDVESEVSDHVRSLLDDYKQREGRQFASLLENFSKGQPCGGDVVEQYDSAEVRHGDRLCYKFIKALQLFPQQCIRYQWGGQPLLMTPLPGAGVGECQHCGSSRHFELQLVPPIIPLLALPGYKDAVVEFGTLLVFTCSQSCWTEQDKWREETALVQHDPDEHRFR